MAEPEWQEINPIMMKDMMEKMMSMMEEMKDKVSDSKGMMEEVKRDVSDSKDVMERMAEKVVELEKKIDESSHNPPVKEFQVHYLYANALGAPRLNIKEEVIALHHSHVVVRLTCATRANLLQLRNVWTGQEVLHLSCHGGWRGDQYYFHLEKSNGQNDEIKFVDMLNDIIPDTIACAPGIVVIASCHSGDRDTLINGFLNRGVQTVVAIQNEIKDAAARTFAKRFYHELRVSGRTGKPRLAFDKAKHDVNNHYPSEAAKLIIHQRIEIQPDPSGDPADFSSFSHVGVRFRGVLDDSFSPLLTAPSSHLNRPYQSFDEYDLTLKRILHLFVGNPNPTQVVTLNGPSGSGKKALASELLRFSTFPGGRFFSGGGVILSPNSVLPQKAMKQKFGAKLWDHGIRKSKEGQYRFARQARLGEKIPKVEDGEVKSISNVLDETSWVIRQESVDRELYVLNSLEFEKNYKIDTVTPISKIHSPDIPKAELEALEQRGYQRFERQGTLLVYFITKDDMEEFPGDECEFEFRKSSSPLKFKVGTPLVTPLVKDVNDMEDIYVSQNAKQIYGLTDAEIGKQAAGISAAKREAKESIAEASINISPRQMLQNCIDQEAPKQARLLEQWYASHCSDADHQPELRYNRTSALDNYPRGPTPLQHWMSMIPQDAHGLCVLFGGDKYLQDESCRVFLRDILHEHRNLCLLITVTKEVDEEKHHWFDNKEFKEVSVNMDELGDKSAAKLFHHRINRKVLRPSDFGEAGDEKLKENQVLEKLQTHEHITECGGNPGEIVKAADRHNKGKKLWETEEEWEHRMKRAKSQDRLTLEGVSSPGGHNQQLVLVIVSTLAALALFSALRYLR